MRACTSCEYPLRSRDAVRDGDGWKHRECPAGTLEEGREAYLAAKRRRYGGRHDGDHYENFREAIERARG